MSDAQPPRAKGRGSQIHPPNRFGVPHHEFDWEQIGDDTEHREHLHNLPTEYIPDRTRSIVSTNDSPDLFFRFSLNPYRGCQHGCAYCYARPTHEYLGYNAGLDFETKILVKHDAPALFREFLAADSWKPEPITFSGVTDCYQPAERQFRLTRGCLEVAAEARQPITIVTKNALVLRDVDLLQDMAASNLVHVFLGVTTLDAELARSMEPRTSAPHARLTAIETLARAGVPTGVMVAPVIPGLNDSEIPAILSAVKHAGALRAYYTLLRLPLTVAPVFREWLEREQPGRQQRIEGRIRATRGGALSDSEWGRRMRGTGELAEQIGDLFRLFAKKYQLDGAMPLLDATHFRAPRASSGQLSLF
jgi:DNA repair photolyase